MTSKYVEIIVGSDCNQNGSRQRINELYGYLRPSLQAYLGSRGLSREHSEDVIQEAFLRLVRRIVERGPDENPHAWVFRVAHNLSMDFHRSVRRRSRGNESDSQPVLHEHADPAPNPEQKVLHIERVRRFRESFAQLTPRQRHCLLLRARGMRYREISLVMGVSIQRVSELMQRAISRVEAGG